MKRLITILSCLLGVQLLLAVLLFSSDEELGALKSNEKLVDLQLENLDSIVIASADQSLTLIKQQNTWQIKEYLDSPVASSKLQQITDKVFAINSSWPIATTESAAPRFKVADSKFERKISFRKGSETLKTLYLGTSPGFKKIHARIDQHASIYSIELSAFEFSTKADDWVDQTLLHIDKNELQQIQMSAFSLSRKDQVWQLEQLKQGVTEDQNAINQLLDKLSRLSFTTIEGIENKAEYGLDKPALSYTLIDKSGKQIEYTFAKVQEKPEYILKTSNQPYYFKVLESSAQAILGTSLESLSKLEEKAIEPVEDESDGEVDNVSNDKRESE